MDEAAIWSQLDSILNQQRFVSKHEEDDQYMCACGGVKTFQYEFPTCTTCGRVDNVFISDEAEWIGGPDSEDDPSRVGIPSNSLLYSENWGMGTLIVGRACERMAKISLHSSMNHRDRALHHAYTQFDHICKGKLKLNDVVIEQAKIVYKKFNEEKLTRGAVRFGVKANCVLYACKEHGVSRSLQEIAEAFNIPVKDISRTNEIFKSVTGEETGTTFSSDIISRLFNSINFIPDTEKGRVRMKIIKACEESQNNPMLMGKTPKGVASAVIFKTLCDLGYKAEREFVAKICEVSVPTLIKIEKIIREMT
jgi:transcription initiation factor TFIIIB Brf1 subunit/transcription initiation factor TFIIB